MEYFKEDVLYWDVINEAIADEEDQIFRKSKWLDGICEDKVISIVVKRRGIRYVNKK